MKDEGQRNQWTICREQKKRKRTRNL